MQTRFNGNVVPFADDATSTNRTVFGGTTQSDNIDDNLNDDFKKGWEIVGLNDNPTREDFNAMGYTLGALTAYLYEMGIAEWNASQNYRIGSRVIGSDGKIYKALIGTILSPNVNHNPTSDNTNWEWEFKAITDYSALTAKTKPVDADLFALGDSASSFSLKKLSWANLKTALNLLYVDLINNQSIDGIKTFVKSPIVPTPTSGTQAVNKNYADLKVDLASFIGTNQGLTANGYQKLPGGLIIQWGSTNAASTGNVILPTAFPNSCFSVLMLLKGSENTVVYAQSYTTTGFSWATNAFTATGYSSKTWFAIGY